MAAAAAAAADQTGIPLTREGAAVATETEKKSSLVGSARETAKSAAASLEQEWRELSFDAVGKNDQAVLEKLRRKSLLLATKSVFDANRSRLRNRIRDIAREADRLSGKIKKKIREEQSFSGRIHTSSTTRDPVPAVGHSADFVNPTIQTGDSTTAYITDSDETWAGASSGVVFSSKILMKEGTIALDEATPEYLFQSQERIHITASETPEDMHDNQNNPESTSVPEGPALGGQTWHT